MTHYPAWIALIVFSAAFAAVNVVPSPKHQERPDILGGVFIMPITWQQGWPAKWSEHEPAQKIEYYYAPPQPIYKIGVKVSWWALAVDMLIALAVIAGAVFQVAKIKAKLNLQAVFTATAIVGPCCLTLRYQTLNEFLVDARTVAMFVLPIAIGLACLSVLNLVGWIYGKCR